MISYHAKELEATPIRAHPWSTAIADASHAYVDFKIHPELIKSSIEDLVPFSNQEFAKRLYSLIEWINGPESLFESNDCAFRGPQTNRDSQFPFDYKCQGRLMILFRDLAENCQPRSIDWLLSNLSSSIQSIHPNFKAGAIGYSRSATGYKALAIEPGKAAKGSQVMLSFFAYGKNEKRCYESMDKVIECTHSSIARINRKIKAGELNAIYG